MSIRGRLSKICKRIKEKEQELQTFFANKPSREETKLSTAVLELKNLRQIQEFACPKEAPKRIGAVSDSAKIVELINEIADRVQDDWDGFSKAEQDALKDIAYSFIKPSGKKIGFLSRVWLQVQVLILKLKGQGKTLDRCVEALDQLIDNILDAIEREHESYSQEVADTLEELTHNPDGGDRLKPEEISGWLRGLSDKAMSEV